MDVNDVERIDVHALGGADTIVINDLTGTDCRSPGWRSTRGRARHGRGDGKVDR